jgi:hypothetical protein
VPGWTPARLRVIQPIFALREAGLTGSYTAAAITGRLRSALPLPFMGGGLGAMAGAQIQRAATLRVSAGKAVERRNVPSDDGKTAMRAIEAEALA